MLTALVLIWGLMAELSGIPPPFLTNGLVAYYPFNGNANDASGNGNDGTVQGAVPTTDRFGNANSAYAFDGLTDYIELPLNTGNLNGLSRATFSAWINPNQMKGENAIFSHWAGYYVQPPTPDGVEFSLDYQNRLVGAWHPIPMRLPLPMRFHSTSGYL